MGGAKKSKKLPNESSFNFLSNGIWFYGHPSPRNGRNGLPKKNRPEKKSPDAVFIIGPDNILGRERVFSEGHFDHFYYSDGHETIHHSKGN